MTLRRERGLQRGRDGLTDVADGFEGSTGGAFGPGWASVPLVAGGCGGTAAAGVAALAWVWSFVSLGLHAMRLTVNQATAVVVRIRAIGRRMRRPFAFELAKRADTAAGRIAALVAAVACLATACQAGPHAAGPAPFMVERSIPLSGVQGRIDHLAVDSQRKRLFVAELGNGSVESIDLTTGRSLGRVTGLKEPQGVAFLAARNEFAVASGGDGTVRFYRADDLALAGSLKIGDDADNLRVDPGSGDLIVGYGGGALGVIDPATRTLKRKAPLPGHPESFQIESGRAIVNVPNAGAIVTIDLASGREIARWPNTVGRFNFPLALEPEGPALATVYRLPARAALIDRRSGRVIQSLETCGDSDDAFFDAARHRLYVVCGSGSVDVFEKTATGYRATARTTTRGGTRTGLFVPSLDRLYVAARAGLGRGAELMILRPQP